MEKLKTIEECMDILNCSGDCSERSLTECNACLTIELKEEMHNCPSCDSPNFNQEGCFYVCFDCGISEPVDEVDWDYFHSDDDSFGDCD